MIEWIVSSSVLILIVIALRFVLKGKISPRMRCFLWAVVMLRLLIPFSFGATDFSAVQGVSNVSQVKEFNSLAPVENISRLDGESAEITYRDSVLYGRSKTAYEPDKSVLFKPAEYFDRMERMLFLRKAASIVWLGGIALMTAVFLFSNLRFASMLKRSRHPLADCCGYDISDISCPVYMTQSVKTPCLFGLISPAIYITPAAAADTAVLRHALQHENTHYLRRDNLRAAVRCICLILHWYNPLVWLAAFLSVEDSELACDEATIQRLGESERLSYGRTLIDMTCQGHSGLTVTATTMVGSKNAIKRRIESIAKKPKMAAGTLAAVIVIAAIAIVFTFAGPENGSFYDWLQSVETDDITYADVSKNSPKEGYQAKVSLDDFEKLPVILDYLHKVQPEDLKECDAGETGSYDYQVYIKTPIWETRPDDGFREYLFNINSDGKVYVTFDSETARLYCRKGKSWVFSSPELYEYISGLPEEWIISGAAPNAVTAMAAVKASDFTTPEMLRNITPEKLAAALNAAAAAGQVVDFDEKSSPYYQTEIMWCWDVGDAYLEGNMEEGVSGHDLHFDIKCDLTPDIVKVTYGTVPNLETIYLKDTDLYNTVRSCSDVEEFVDTAAYEKFRYILVPQMERHLEYMSENPGNFTGYELTLFRKAGEYKEKDGARVEVYDFDYGLLTDTPEKVGMVGGMHFDSKCRLHGFNGGGQLAVRYRDGKIAATAFMGNDFWYTSSDSGELLDLNKMRLKEALDLKEELDPTKKN